LLVNHQGRRPMSKFAKTSTSNVASGIVYCE
jgi:hypothetical protein